MRLNQASKEERFTGLYYECFDYVYSYVYTRTAGDKPLTEDIVQETFTVAWQSFNKFQNKSSYKTWFCSIAKNKLNENYRRVISREKVDQSAYAGQVELPSHFDLEKIVQDDEIRQRVLQILNEMNPLYRYVLIMKYIDDLSVKEIARALRKTEKSIDGVLQRAKAIFEKHM